MEEAAHSKTFMHLGGTLFLAFSSIRLKAAGSGALWLIPCHFSCWAIDFTHTPSCLSASIMVFIIYSSAPSHLSLCSLIYLRLSPSFEKTLPIQSRPRMASAVPGLAPPPGVVPDLTSPYTLQPYQALTAVACIIVTTVMVAARLYTVSTVPSHSFPILYQH